MILNYQKQNAKDFLSVLYGGKVVFTGAVVVVRYGYDDGYGC